MIGFIGLGDMGMPMVRHLLATGHAVTVWNRTAARCEALAADTPVQVAASPAALARACDVIGLCLSSHVTVQALCEGEDGLFAQAAAAGRRPVFVDFSTGSPQVAQALAAAAQRHGAQWVDAPVSGGPPAAAAGTLTILAGGTPEAVAAAQGLLDGVASHVTHLGPAGAGQMTKLCNQLIVASNVMAVAEATALARRAGVDPTRLAPALAGGFADSRPLQLFGPRMAAHAFTPRLGALELMEKDVNLVNALALDSGAITPLAAQVAALFAQAHERADIDPQGDLSQVIRLFEATPSQDTAP